MGEDCIAGEERCSVAQGPPDEPGWGRAGAAGQVARARLRLQQVLCSFLAPLTPPPKTFANLTKPEQ